MTKLFEKGSSKFSISNCFLVILLLVLATTHSFGQKKDRSIDGIIAVVADKIILYSELKEQLTNYSRSGNTVDQNTECLLFEELLFQKLLVHQSEVDSLVVEEKEIQAEIDRRLDYFINQFGSPQKLEDFYGKKLIDIKDEFHDLIENQIKSQRMQGEITANVSVSPKEVRKFYESIPKDSLPFINSEVEIAHIVFDPQIQEEEKERVKIRLKEIRDRVLAGEDFGTLAYLYSEDPGSGRKNGELGFLTRSMLVPEFAAAAFSLQKGETSEIVESEFGFHIIQLIEKRGQEANFRHILLKPKVHSSDFQNSRSKADSVLKLVNMNSLTFEKAAQLVSDDKDTKLNDGKLANPATGTTKFEMDQLSQLDPSLFFVLDKMSEGDISEPVIYQKPDGSKAYRLVKLITATEPHRANLKKDYQRIQAVAKANKEKEEVDKWIQKNIEKNYIRIEEEFKNCEFQHNWFN